MMLVVFLLFAVLIIAALYILLTKQERKTPTSAKVAPSERDIKPPKTDAFQKKPMPPPEEILPLEMKRGPDAGGQEMGVPDVYRDLRRIVQQGIEVIFSGQKGENASPRTPFMYNQIDPDILRTVEEQIGHLKKFRTEHLRLQKFVSDPAIQMSDLAKMILADPVLTAKILRLANSPYFGMQNKIDSISHALMILGLQNIKNILYREGLLQLFPMGSAKQKDALAALWTHSTLTSVCASCLADLFDGLNQGTLFTLGIIHDIGKLVILGMPRVQSFDGEFWDKLPRGFYIQDEDELLGVNHAVIGKMALEQWGFSDLMVHSVAMHHMPAYVHADSLHQDGDIQKYITALFIADQIARLLTGRIDLLTPLADSYRTCVDRNRLLAKLTDTTFLSQIREAAILADSEFPVKPAPAAASAPIAAVVGQTNNASHKTDGRFQGDATAVIARPEPGKTIGRYEIIGELGRGAMGTVYLGRDPLINREVAIKTLRYGHGDDEEMAAAKKRFFREAEAAGRLTHPNIVTVYDVGEYQGTAYMAMELLDGTDLVSFCSKDSLLPFDDVVKIVSTVAVALDYAHKNGVVHRDVKPGNIRILSRGDIKVVDFGIAKVMDTSKTQAGVIIGSPNYMSPEQIEGRAVDGRTDLFSLGVLFYELLTGEKPFVGESITTLMHNIVSQPAPPIKDLIPAVPEYCGRILEKALAKKMEDRYQSGQEMADDLMTPP